MKIKALIVGAAAAIVALVGLQPGASGSTGDWGPLPQKPAFGKSAPYPLVRGDLTLSPSNAKPGTKVSVAGTGFAPGSSIVYGIVCDSFNKPLGTATTDSSGAWSDTVVIPSGCSGECVMVAIGPNAGGGTRMLGANINTGGSLPKTGSFSWPLAASGFGLTAIGIAALAWARRRRTD